MTHIVHVLYMYIVHVETACTCKHAGYGLNSLEEPQGNTKAESSLILSHVHVYTHAHAHSCTCTCT